MHTHTRTHARTHTHTHTHTQYTNVRCAVWKINEPWSVNSGCCASDRNPASVTRVSTGVTLLAAGLLGNASLVVHHLRSTTTCTSSALAGGEMSSGCCVCDCTPM